MKLAVISFVFWMVAVHFEPTIAADCPPLKPVKVDEDFLFKNQPAGGFYAPVTTGVDSMPQFTPKPMPPIQGTGKACYKARMKVNALEIPSPPVECQYSSVGEMMCESKGGSAAALSAAGLKMPKHVRYTIVDTDNQSWLAIGACMDGSLYMWGFLTTEPGNPKIKASTLKALHITAADVKASQGKKIKIGRTEIAKGACGAGGGLGGGSFGGFDKDKLGGLLGG